MSHFGRLIFLFLVMGFISFQRVSATPDLIGAVETPVLKKITISDDSASIPLSDKEREFFSQNYFPVNYRNKNFTFELTSDDSLIYQFYLENFDGGWSEWRNTCFKEYTNLPAGRYILHTRYLQSEKEAGELSPFRIRVLPSWYFSPAAIICYLILLLLIIRTLYDHLNLRFARKQYLLEQIINTRTEDLILEKEKTEALLANLLPKNTADEIMSKGKATKMKYNFVTVLFSDIQGFTKIAEEMNPEVLIDELDKFFFHFDSVVEKYGIEKIKTIGDAYMCAGGIPEKNRTNPVEIILAALEMRKYMDRLKETSEIEGMKFWDIRVGIHTGTVVAGVVGHKKLSYDIWGDTVNTASRMESSGEAGKINISGTTHEFVKEFFTCEYRGKMPVKYKGDLEMYFVNGIIPELSDETGGPNDKFLIKIQKIKIQDIEDVITKMFDEEAPPDLYFHNSSLLHNISTQVELISTAERLPDEEYINLKLASIFFLTGFITDYEKPMEASARLVEEILPKYGFNKENIDKTKKIIRNSYEDVRESLVDNIMHDARYDYLGRVDYTRLTEKLARERTEYGKHSDNKAWIEIQVKQQLDHDFITDTARLLRSVSIEEQISAIKLQAE